MKNKPLLFLKLTGMSLLIAFGFVLAVQAQNREKYVISAKAGGVNYAYGNVTVERAGAGRQEALTLKDNLETGDRVTTGMGGRIEVLLNPGSYMRVDENSEFELADASLDQLLVKLTKGSAIVEVTGGDDVQLAIGFDTPQASTTIVRGGIYRFNVLPNGTTEILVRKGRVYLEKGTPSEIKGGQKVTIGPRGMEVAKLNKKEQDSLDLWSKDRAELLARANRQLQPRPLLTAFNDLGWNDPYDVSLTARYYRLGLWVYNQHTGGYCFLPLGGRAAWSSPYGHRYGTGLGLGENSNNWPGRNPQAPGYTQGGGGSGGSQSGGNGGSVGGSSNQPSAPPPQSAPPPPPPPEPAIERAPHREYTTNTTNPGM